MRRRKPRSVRLIESDHREIERLLRDGRTEQRVARRGQVLPEMKDPDTSVFCSAHPLPSPLGFLPTRYLSELMSEGQL